MEFVELIKTPKLDGVFLQDHLNATVEGRLCITGHHLLLSARQENSQELWLMHKNIDNVDKKPFMVQNSVVGGLITLKCKDLRIISLKIKHAKEYLNVAASLEALSALSNPELEYPFFYRPMYTILEDGYTIFRPELEFSKLISTGACNNSTNSSCNSNNLLTTNNLSPLSSTFPIAVVNGHDVAVVGSGGTLMETAVGCEWRITHINKDFKLCPTYGSVLIVPKSITDEQIVQSAAFRDGGRFPVLSYRHENGFKVEITKKFKFIGNSNNLLTTNNLSPLSSTFPIAVVNGHDVAVVGSGGTLMETAVGCEWRITHINKDFKLCPTYGSVLIVPKSITDEQIVQSAAFRDGGRFPVLSYRHENGAALLRSAQPLTIQGIKRCRADEAILNVVLGRSKKGFIVDTWGKGKSNTETDQHYSQWKKVNRSIGNVSTPAAILDSFSKLIEACNDVTCSPDKWLSRLESSNWLSLVLNSLNAACVVAQCLDQEGSPVLVHGAKGLDSTLIVTSLVQIILNPDCRTVRGIQALIEREWIQAGHPFASRHRHSCYTPSQNRLKSSGATFVLFLDCIHQLFKQFPCSFEFSTQLLILLFEHSYFSQYGTFLCDSEKERHELNVHSRTTSLWSYLNRPEVLKNYLNALYEPNPTVIWPSVAPISLDLWNELYLRWIVDQKNNENTLIQIQELVTNEKELRTKALKLRKQATDLASEVLNMIKSSN